MFLLVIYSKRIAQEVKLFSVRGRYGLQLMEPADGSGYGQGNMRFIATGAAGVETLMEEEIRDFGGREVRKDLGLVEWRGPLESGYRACLWSRCSSRILLPVHEFTGQNEDELYEGVRQVRWENHLDAGTTFAVDCVLSKDAPYRHSKFASLRVKDGIADYFRDKFGKRPDVRVERPGVRVNVHADGSRTLVSIDLSGESLHKRGYRKEGGVLR